MDIPVYESDYFNYFEIDIIKEIYDNIKIKRIYHVFNDRTKVVCFVLPYGMSKKDLEDIEKYTKLHSKNNNDNIKNKEELNRDRKTLKCMIDEERKDEFYKHRNRYDALLRCIDRIDNELVKLDDYMDESKKALIDNLSYGY